MDHHDGKSQHARRGAARRLACQEEGGIGQLDRRRDDVAQGPRTRGGVEGEGGEGGVGPQAEMGAEMGGLRRDEQGGSAAGGLDLGRGKVRKMGIGCGRRGRFVEAVRFDSSGGFSAGCLK